MFLVGFLWSCLCHLQYTKSQYPKSCMAYQDLLHICSISFYFFKPKQTICLSLFISYVYSCVSSINQVFVICCYFTIWNRLSQLCFTRVILDLGDCHKWIIASLNRFVHWKVRFQSLPLQHHIYRDSRKLALFLIYF